MIAYFDTSAVIHLLIEEPGSAVARRLWDEAGRVVAVRLVYPEARAALAQAERTGRVAAGQLRAAVAGLDDLFGKMHVIELDAGLAQAAGDLAEDQRLRGFDAVHLAAAQRVADADLVVVAGDRALLRAAADMALAVATIG